jgi:NAD+--asparagine ADP-ribosyltransferase
VERFEIVATLDSHTSEICRELDGHVEEMKNYEVGVTAPPFHPFAEPLLYHTLTIMTVKDSPETVVVKVFIFRQTSHIMSGRSNL